VPSANGQLGLPEQLGRAPAPQETASVLVSGFLVSGFLLSGFLVSGLGSDLPLSESLLSVLALPCLAPLFLKSVAYQPLPLSWNPAAVSIFENVSLPHSGQRVRTGAVTFCRYSFWKPQTEQRYS